MQYPWKVCCPGAENGTKATLLLEALHVNIITINELISITIVSKEMSVSISVVKIRFMRLFYPSLYAAHVTQV